jgi:hypothetical protein
MLKKKITVILTAVTGLAITPMLCLADATGLITWGEFPVTIGKGGVSFTVNIPSGTLAHSIIGDGGRVNSQIVTYNSFGYICDPSIKYTYGNRARSTNSAIARGCWRRKEFTFNPRVNVPRGRACAELWSEDWRVFIVERCHFIEG